MGASFAPIEKAEGVLRVTRHAEGVDETGGENGLLEAIGTALAVQVGEHEADCCEVIAGIAEAVQEFAELRALLRQRLTPLHPSE